MLHIQDCNNGSKSSDLLSVLAVDKTERDRNLNPK